ncbi:hypothetical protein [Pseudomonas mosselii]|uniref:hypothetical protein n=1 Tax=Pseudomonas mosselii TaxID=78327 RepID=UPI003F2A5452
MPTENRSSNTEMVSVPRERAELLINLLAEVARTAHWLADNSEDCGDEGIDCQRVDFEALSDALGKCEELPELPDSPYVRDGWLRAADELRALLAQPAQQYQVKPVAVVGFIPGGEYKSLDFKTDLQQLQVGSELYTHADPGEVERLTEQLEVANQAIAYAAQQSQEKQKVTDALMADAKQFRAERDTLRAQLAERDVLLRDLVQANLEYFPEEECPPQHPGLMARYAALSASAEPGESASCTWTYNENSFAWDTTCSESFMLMEDGPKENCMKFCPYCSKSITQAPTSEEQESKS